MMAGFAPALFMAGFCVTGTSAPAVSPGPNGGTEITCSHVRALLSTQCCCMLKTNQLSSPHDPKIVCADANPTPLCLDILTSLQDADQVVICFSLISAW